MSGVVFIISIPTEEYQRTLINKAKKKVIINEVSPGAKKSGRKFLKSETRSQENVANDHVKNGVGIRASSSSGNLPLNREIVDEISEAILEPTMCKVLEDVLVTLGINNSTWTTSPNNKFVQIVFPLESSDDYEEVLEILKSQKIGVWFKSVISVVPCSIYCSSSEKGTNVPPLGEDTPDKDEHLKTTAWHRFISSVRSRLAVAQVVEKVKSNAMLTFNFIALLMIATILCAIGLVENSNVYLLSSMLISPMMGPVMAGTFGTVIRDSQLQIMGVKNELIGLGIATVTGFFYGVIICMFTDKYGDSDWPTHEMTSRGETHGLWVGSLIALLSGGAIALGILSDNTASLVGVAISASLMPPAVNAGLLWSIASMNYLRGTETARFRSPTSFYSKTNKSIELAALGGVSLCLTFVNIVCIYVAGILVFKIKEVAPITSKDKAGKQFWRYDIKIARDYNRTLVNENARILHQQFEKDMLGYQKYGRYSPHRFNVNFQSDLLHHSTDLGKETAKVKVKRSQLTWSPCTYVSRGAKYPDPENPGSSGSDRNTALPQDVPNKKRLSQIFSPIKLKCSNNDTERNMPISETDSASSTEKCEERHCSSASNKKFIVTPCPSDPLKNK